MAKAKQYFEVGDRIWWSQPEQGSGRIVYSGNITRVNDSKTSGKIYSVKTGVKDGVIRLVGHTRAMKGRKPKNHDGYE